MTMEEGLPAGSVSDIGKIGEEFSFTLYDHEDRELMAFLFDNEADARGAWFEMKRILGRAVALSPADDRGFVAVPIVKA
jgi:hypothetical protein